MANPVIGSQAALKLQQTYNVQPPKIIDLNNSGAVVYDKAIESGEHGLLVLQNLGVQPVKVCINDVASANLFHFVLGAGTATDDGTGGIQDHSALKVAKCTIFCAGVGRVSVFKAYANI